MAFRGTKPKPTALRLAHHSRGKLNPHEPQHPALEDDVPEELTDPLAVQEWRRILAIVKDTAHLQRVDRATVVVYCRTWGQFIRAEKEAARHPLIVKGVNNGPMPNPAISLSNRLAVLLIRAAGELGFTPSARTRVVATPTSPGGGDDFTRFQMQRRRL